MGLARKLRRPAFLSQLEAWCEVAKLQSKREVTEGTLMNDLVLLCDSGGEVCGA